MVLGTRSACIRYLLLITGLVLVVGCGGSPDGSRNLIDYTTWAGDASGSSDDPQVAGVSDEGEIPFEPTTVNNGDKGGNPDNESDGSSGGTGTSQVVLTLEPRVLNFSATHLADRVHLSLADAGDVTPWALSSNRGWVKASPAEGRNYGEVDEITVSVDMYGLPAGEHYGVLTIDLGSYGQETIDVTMSVPPEGPPEWHHVAGTVRAGGQGGLADVIVTTNDGYVVTRTDESGVFDFMLPHGWSGTVGLRDVNHKFSPEAIVIQDLQADLLNVEVVGARLVPDIPMVAVRRQSDNLLLRYQGEKPTGTVGPDFTYVATFDDANASVTLTWLGDDFWELELTPKVAIKEFWFPYELSCTALNGDSSDDVLYTPRLCGVAERSDAQSTSLGGNTYPGFCFAPLLVLADPHTAKIVAATNWPPVEVNPTQARGRTCLLYREGRAGVPAVGETRKVRLLQARASGDERVGLHAWQRVLEQYRLWLEAAGEAAGLFPIDYSPWMRDCHGFMIVWLSLIPDPALPGAPNHSDYLWQMWEQWREVFPWMQMWGQMADYNESDPICCGEGPFHPRYEPGMREFADLITSSGGHIGYYSRPEEPYEPIDGWDPESLLRQQRLLDWLDDNHDHGANVWYLDVLGARYFGDPATIADLFVTKFPRDTFMEYVTDVYPTALYLYNSIWGSGLYGSGPDYTDCSECFDANTPKVTFPRFGRFLLGDRITFLGSAGGARYWGREHDYWMERQVFLLGAKYAVHHGLVSEEPEGNELNLAIGLAVSERDRAGWWERRPVYRDTEGVYGVPPEVKVRHFIDKDGIDLFAVDNWFGTAGASFGFEGREIPIPAQPLAIIEWRR